MTGGLVDVVAQVRLKKGQAVQLQDLEQRSHLNGQTGTVVSHDRETGRFRVQLHQPPFHTVKVFRENCGPVTEEEDGSQTLDPVSESTNQGTSSRWGKMRNAVDDGSYELNGLDYQQGAAASSSSPASCWGLLRGAQQTREYRRWGQAEEPLAEEPGDDGEGAASPLRKIKMLPWPPAPKDRVLMEYRQKKPPPPIVKGKIAKEIEREMGDALHKGLRDGDGDNRVHRLRNIGVSFFKDGESGAPDVRRVPREKCPWSNRAPRPKAGGLLPGETSDALVAAVQASKGKEALMSYRATMETTAGAQKLLPQDLREASQILDSKFSARGTGGGRSNYIMMRPDGTINPHWCQTGECTMLGSCPHPIAA